MRGSADDSDSAEVAADAKVAADAPVLTATKKPEPLEPGPAVAHTPWIRPLADYERKETTIVEGLRYG